MNIIRKWTGYLIASALGTEGEDVRASIAPYQ
jgi:hypothetical protein